MKRNALMKHLRRNGAVDRRELNIAENVASGTIGEWGETIRIGDGNFRVLHPVKSNIAMYTLHYIKHSVQCTLRFERLMESLPDV